MKVLILGGTGAMGKHLVDLLAKVEGTEISVTSRGSRKSIGNVSYVRGDAHDMAFLFPLLEKRFDAIVDFMVYRTDEFRERIGTLLDSCGQYVFLSSARVYADSPYPITEDSPRLLDVTEDVEYLRTDEYALTKARQENLLRDSGHSNWTIVRPYVTYSENRLQLGVLEKEAWLYRALRGRSIVFSKDIAGHLTTLTYGLDVARGIASLIGRKEARGEAFHITASESVRWSEVLDMYLNVLERKTGKRPPVWMTEECLNLRYGWAKYQVKYDRLFNRSFDNTKIGRFIDTGSFKSPAKGLRSCLESFLESPSFLGVNWRGEAEYDRLTGERASFCEIPSAKQKVKYLLYRYII